MKKSKYIIIAVVMFVAVILLLFYNKKKIQAQSKIEYREKFYVSVAKAESKIPTENISLVGTITANNDVNIISETSGRVTQVLANVGDYKQAGSVIVQVDDELKKAAYSSALANYEKSKKDFERMQSLLESKSASDVQFDAAKLAYVNAESQFIIAKRQLNDTKITTPISGYITSRLVDVGSYVASGPNATMIANVVDISKLKVKVNISEKDAFLLKSGDNVEVTTDVYPDAKYLGKIASISSKGDEAHTYPIEISIQNRQEKPLKAGMFARIYFSSLVNSHLILIPREAIVGSIRTPQVFVVKDGTARLRDISVGNQYDTFVEVINGVNEGDDVVISGQNLIQNNFKVEIVK
ncbi:MAG: efflux RND transporter periplasmic adaptor subunit [Ignavibacteriae bacterium]|nr:efflux RND transporter periplasmic adaptor subunit [Ignavibacteriota bacterium]